MFTWREVPFVRLLLPFIIGILLAIYWDTSLTYSVELLTFLLLVLLVINQQKIAFRFRWIYGSLLNIALLLLGYHITYHHNELRQANHFQHQLSQQNIALGTITNMPDKSREKWVKMSLDVQQIGGNVDSLYPCSGSLLVYIENDSNSQQLKYGDVLILKSWLNPMASPKNPKAFDYRRYLYLKNIHYQTFVRGGKWKIVAQNKGNPILKMAYRWRAELIEVLHQHLTTVDEFAVGSALILGYKYELSDDLRNAYAGTGAIHVLAVSGLHVGLIYIIITFLLKKLTLPLPHWKIIQVMVTLAVIWIFALLTGASASVMRAATMFSFFVVGNAFQRYINIYNTLAISAFLLLFLNPYLIKDISFQLSYSAVLGIVYFQPKIYRFWIIDNRVGDYCWELMTVSIAAQLATLPLSLYYFHQFPTYFWLSGLVVVPAAGIILSLGLLLFFFHWCFSPLAYVLAKLLYGIIWGVNAVIFAIEQLPFSLFQGIWIGLFGAILIYLIFLAIILAINTRQYRAIVAAAFLLFVFSASHAFRHFFQHQKRQIVIYHIPQHSIIDCIDGKQLYTLLSEEINEKNYGYTVDNYRWSLGIEAINTTYFYDSLQLEKTWIYEPPFIGFYDKKIALVDKPIVQNASHKIKVDWVLLRGNPKVYIEALLENYDFDQLIFDASNSLWRTEKWKESCERLGVPFYDINEQGAFRLDF